MMKRAGDKVNNNGRRRGYDILPKILCLIAAFILWLYVTQVETSDFEETFNGVSVELVNTSVLEAEKGLYVYSGYGNTVNVTVSGKKSDINRYTSENIRVFADVSEITESGRHTIPLTAEAPAGLGISELSLSSVAVYVDQRSTIEVDVKPKISSAVIGDGYELGELAPEYTLVTVTGPKTVLNDVDYAQISLELGTVSSSLTTIGELELVSKSSEAIDMRYVQLNRSEMTVTVPVYTTKSVPLSIAYKYGYYNNNNVKITFEPENVVIKGDPKELESIDTIVLGTIDETMITADVKQVYTLSLPEGVTSVDNIETIDVSISHLGTTVRSFTVDEIQVTGAGKLKYELLTNAVAVRLRGPKTTLERIKSDNITVSVDLSEYGDEISGTMSVLAEVSVGGSFAGVYHIGECLIQLKIG